MKEHRVPQVHSGHMEYVSTKFCVALLEPTGEWNLSYSADLYLTEPEAGVVADKAMSEGYVTVVCMVVPMFDQ